MKSNLIFGWHSPRFAVWSVMMERGTEAFVNAMHGGPRWPAVRLVLVGLLRWLRWCLPAYGADETGESYRFLAFHLNVVRGPHTCSFCGRATQRGADLVRGVPAHCGRRACFNSAHPIDGALS